MIYLSKLFYLVCSFFRYYDYIPIWFFVFCFIVFAGCVAPWVFGFIVWNAEVAQQFFKGVN